MSQFAPDQFFDLQEWRHASLLAPVSSVWEALGERLKEYLGEWPEWRIEIELPDGVHLLGDRISIAPGCRIEPGAVIVGPAILGENVTVRTGAYVRENVIVGAGCMVGAHSEIKGSILLPKAKAPHQNYVGDSILGRDVNLGAGTICSNVKNIGREVTFRAGGELIHTGLRKLGAVLGDGCKTGCNTVLNPGVLMGPGSVTYPNATLRSGLYPAQTLVKVRQSQQTIELGRLRRDG
jgi:NDP-sugar pyrophosphorylase family protein